MARMMFSTFCIVVLAASAPLSAGVFSGGMDISESLASRLSGYVPSHRADRLPLPASGRGTKVKMVHRDWGVVTALIVAN